MQTPVVLLIYNRPELTRRAMEPIRKARPRRLFVVADGPRREEPRDAEKCETARAAATEIDWPCEVLIDCASENLGCARRVSSGLDWVFDRVEEAIVLEDDCVADPSFLAFCDQILSRYLRDTRVMAVAGNNFQSGKHRCAHDYYFSRYPHCWGWATWRRAWRHFDFDMEQWSELRDNEFLNGMLMDRAATKYWTRIFDDTRAGRIDSWAYRWTFACWAQNGLTVLPRANLVSNIGFGDEATHTVRMSRFSCMPTSSLSFPLHHPRSLVRDDRADRYTERIMFSGTRRGLAYRSARFLARRLTKLVAR